MSSKQTKFETLIVDADKILLTAAQSVEENYVEITHKNTGETIEVSKITDFWGRKRSGLDGEVGKWITFLGIDGLKREDFEIVHKVRLRDDIDNHLEEAKISFDRQVGFLKAIDYINDYRLCIHGEGNFRDNIAKILPYKGGRKEKPVVFHELKDLIFSQYKNKVIISNGYESDDKLGMIATENQNHFRKTGEYKYLLAYCDKDLNQLSGPHINFDKKEEGVIWISPTEACYNFCMQMIMGDKGTDNIQGLPALKEETQKRLGLRKGSGCGEVSAKAALEGMETPKDMIQAVVDMYKEYYDKDITFISDSDGKKYTYSWKEFFIENWRLLWMLRDENIDFDIWGLLDKLGVDYEGKHKPT